MSEAILRRLRAQLGEARSLRDEARALSERQLLPGSTKLVLSQLPREVTLAEAAARVADAYNLLHGGLYNRVVRRGGLVSFRTDDRNFPFAVDDPGLVTALMEETLLFTHALLSLVASGPAGEGLRSVALRRRSGQPAVPFGRLAETRLGAAVYALRYDAGLADRAVPRPPREDLTYEAVVRTQIAILERSEGHETPLGDQVLAALRAGAASQEEVAAALDISSATLRRRLAQAGASFRGIQAALMVERADALLATSEPLEQVAERLGFSDVRAFNRAYRLRCGLTPAAARRQAS